MCMLIATFFLDSTRKEQKHAISLLNVRIRGVTTADSIGGKCWTPWLCHRLPLVSEHLAEVGTTCPPCSRWHTCARAPTYTTICFIRCPWWSWKPHILSWRGEDVCQKNAMVTFFSERPLPRNLWGLLSETSRATNRKEKTEREREKDESVSCSRTKVGLCFREGNIVNLHRVGTASWVTAPSAHFSCINEKPKFTDYHHNCAELKSKPAKATLAPHHTFTSF